MVRRAGIMVPTAEASATRCPTAADVPATTAHAAAVEAATAPTTVETTSTATVTAATMLSKRRARYRNERDCQKRPEQKPKKV
jgi:hypothetical protein